ncbi:hypothetical protein ACFST9_23725 [Hymenobacter monticola]|uniref:Uncharacterized protein n=1 Tax=Hymenobacter monticola TaxID=1705399 RepID=A0ABY4B421_9BACT|nr:hypothetical protein [Hymenobacter monticola]UOE33889.1 hypothetical protein MTP16_22595 [Hymenobacter monticola]
MPAAPRLRQLRRDRTVFTLLMNIVRIYLEESDRLVQQPELRTAPDAELLQLQQVADQWLNLATAYIVRKHRCPAHVAIQLVAELQAELRANIPETEVRRMPLGAVLTLPPGMQA